MGHKLVNNKITWKTEVRKKIQLRKFFIVLEIGQQNLIDFIKMMRSLQTLKSIPSIQMVATPKKLSLQHPLYVRRLLYTAISISENDAQMLNSMSATKKSVSMLT